MSTDFSKKHFKGKRFHHLNVVTPAVDADTLAIVTSELVRKTGAQLKLNAVVRSDKPDMQKTYILAQAPTKCL